MNNDKIRLGKRLRNLTSEYLSDPRGQYFRHLEKILNLYKNSGVSKDEVLEYIKEWSNK